MHLEYGASLCRAVSSSRTLPFIGVYDVFSASLAAKHFDGLFVSGFSFAASHYGLPDIGFIAWPDIVAFVQRLRSVLPEHHIIVDIDDGYCDVDVACHVVAQLEAAGASGVIMEDQARPRKCGHFDGKQILDLESYLVKLDRVLGARRDLMVIARTDSSDPADIERRVRAFEAAGADGILIDGVPSLAQITEVRRGINRPFAFNQIAGGKSPLCTLSELHEAGINIAIYSTPCLFAAQHAIVTAMESLQINDGLLIPDTDRPVTVQSCTSVLADNFKRGMERRRRVHRPDGSRTSTPAHAPSAGSTGTVPRWPSAGQTLHRRQV